MRFAPDVFACLGLDEKEIELVKLRENKKSLRTPEDKTEAIVCDAAYRNKSLALCPLYRFYSAVQMSPFPSEGSVGPALRTVGTLEGQTRCCVQEVCFGHSFIPGNGLDEEGGTIEAQCLGIPRPDPSQDLRGSPDPIADRQS